MNKKKTQKESGQKWENIYQKMPEKNREILTTPTTTSTQPNLTTVEVGFEMIMTLHHHPTFRPVLGIVQV